MPICGGNWNNGADAGNRPSCDKCVVAVMPSGWEPQNYPENECGIKLGIRLQRRSEPKAVRITVRGNA